MNTVFPAPDNWGEVQVTRGGVDLWARILAWMGCPVNRQTRRAFVFGTKRPHRRVIHRKRVTI